MSVDPRPPERSGSARAARSAAPDSPPDGRETRSGRTRERVLEIATMLLAERGYSGTPISAISKASGVLPASIYWHFGSKEGLVGAVIDRAAARLFEQLERAVASERRSASDDPGLAPFRSLHRTLLENVDFRRLLLLVALERVEGNSDALDALRRVRARVVDFLGHALATVLPIDEPERLAAVSSRLAELMLVTMDGLFVARQIAEDPDGELDGLLALVERSIAATALDLVHDRVPTASVAAAWSARTEPAGAPAAGAAARDRGRPGDAR